MDSGGNVYVADYKNFTIRKITPGGVTTTLAGMAGVSGSADATGTAASFSYPSGVAVDIAGTVYVADAGNDIVRKILSNGVVTTLAGTAGLSGSADGVGSAARFGSLNGLAVDGAGNVFVADQWNDTIRKITPAGAVSTLAGTPGAQGSPGNQGFADGIGSAAQFYFPAGVAVDGSGNIFVTDGSNDLIRKVTYAGVVTTVAGSAWSNGDADGTGTTARFNFPIGTAIDHAGNVYVCDSANDTIRKITPAGVVTTIAGTANVAGSADGVGSAALFSGPFGVAVDSADNVYVSDDGNSTIRKITPAGVVTTFAGTAGNYGSTDGAGASAAFRNPSGLTVDSTNNLFVADFSNNTIRKITTSGVVTTVAGTAGSGGSADGTGAAAQFYGPEYVAIDAANSLYVTDTINRTIRKITPAGTVTTLAGTPGVYGSEDGTGPSAQFYNPNGLAVDNNGNLYVADGGNHIIREISPTGVVTTVGGKASVIGSADGLGTAADFNRPTGIAIDPAGNLYIADYDNHSIRKGLLAGPPVITVQPQASTTTSGGGTQFSVTATSVLPLTYQWFFNASQIAGATGSLLSLPGVTSANAGSYTVTVANQLGLVTSNAASLTVSAAPAPSSGSGGGGGGGSMGGWFALALLALGATRGHIARKARPIQLRRAFLAGWR